MARFSFEDQDFFTIDPGTYVDTLGDTGLAAYRQEVSEALGPRQRTHLAVGGAPRSVWRVPSLAAKYAAELHVTPEHGSCHSESGRRTAPDRSAAPAAGQQDGLEAEEDEPGTDRHRPEPRVSGPYPGLRDPRHPCVTGPSRVAPGLRTRRAVVGHLRAQQTLRRGELSTDIRSPSPPFGDNRDPSARPARADQSRYRSITLRCVIRSTSSSGTPANWRARIAWESGHVESEWG